MVRYVIAYLLPDNLLPKPGHNLHVTLIPTFFLKIPDSLSSIQTYIQSIEHIPACTFGSPGIFPGPEKPILYLPILPPEPLTQIHLDLRSKILDRLDFDLSVYDDHRLPSYLPHVSLDYHFNGDITQIIPPPGQFNLSGPYLFAETSPQKWDIV